MLMLMQTTMLQGRRLLLLLAALAPMSVCRKHKLEQMA